MRERLQEDAGTGRKVSATNGATGVILDDEYSDVICRIIGEAKREIRICAYAWRWYENNPTLGIQKINIALLRAIARGVAVRCIVDGDTVAFRLRSRGLRTKYVEKTRMMHAKVFCIDDVYLAVGSHNLTKRALRDNFEASILTNQYEPIAQFCMYFDTLWEATYES